MLLKGYHVFRSNHLGWRMGKEGDKDIFGDPINKNEIVPVRIADCRLYTDEEGIRRYDPSEAPAIRTSGHSYTYLTYGVTRVLDKPILWPKSPKKKQSDTIILPYYFTSPVYAVYDGILYQGSYQMARPDLSYFVGRGVGRKRAQVLVDEFKGLVKKWDINKWPTIDDIRGKLVTVEPWKVFSMGMMSQDFFAERYNAGEYEAHEISAHCLQCAKVEVLSKYGGKIDTRGSYKSSCGAFAIAMNMTIEDE